MTDLRDDEEMRAFLKAAMEKIAPGMAASAVAMSIAPDDKGDAKFWVELGAMIMYEKPIILLVIEGRPIPQKLQRVADEILVVPDGEWDDDVNDQIEAAVNRLMGEAS